MHRYSDTAFLPMLFLLTMQSFQAFKEKLGDAAHTMTDEEIEHVRQLHYRLARVVSFPIIWTSQN
ncbi:hypothetical protein MJD09_06415 [bacterium]|nr:hypothetical protein [bacterium]